MSLLSRRKRIFEKFSQENPFKIEKLICNNRERERGGEGIDSDVKTNSSDRGDRRAVCGRNTRRVRRVKFVARSSGRGTRDVKESKWTGMRVIPVASEKSKTLPFYVTVAANLRKLRDVFVGDRCTARQRKRYLVVASE